MNQILLMVVSLLLFPSCDKNDSGIEIEPSANMGESIHIIVGSTAFIATLYDNSTTKVFLTMLPMTINMGEMNGNEKYYDLPNSLPAANVRPATICNGDIMLYGSRTLVLFYETFSTSYSYTKIGRVDNPLGLKAALGAGSITVKFKLE